MRVLAALPLVLTAATASAQNLVGNGDFSLGNTGFSSDYTYVAPGTNVLFPDSVYTLTTNTVSPFVLNTQGSGMPDYNEHTTGAGLFMAVNGSTTTDSLVWEQTLSGLAVGRSYRFGAWVSRWTLSDEAAANLVASIDGFEIASFNDPELSGVWVERGGLFTATSTRMTLQIRNLADAFRGNDFGLDDISVEAVPEPASLTALGLGLVGFARARKARQRTV